MARTVVDAKLVKREQRLRLRPRKEPYWLTITEGEHLGYYRGARVGKWVARFRAPGGGGSYQRITLGEADDVANADGEVVLSFKDAQAKARHWFAAINREHGRKRGAYSVSDALTDYLANFRGKDLDNTRRRIEAMIRPQLGDYEVAKLTSDQISKWHREVADGDARLRTGTGRPQNYRPTPDSADGRRRRRSSANRILTILKAALNAAYRSGKVASDDAWRRVRPFPNADAPKLRYLSDDEARRLVNGCSADLRPLAQAALLTGARYSELINLEVRDFDERAGTLQLRETKAGISRPVYLEEEGRALFASLVLGKRADQPVFLKASGGRWGASHQSRPLAAACKAASLDSIGFHDLRRTYGARMALRGVPMAVIASALGHADERITRRHYAHLSKSYVADTIRAAVSGLGVFAEHSNVDRLAISR